MKSTHSVTKTEISVFGRQALDAERRRSPSLADKVLRRDYHHMVETAKPCYNNQYITLPISHSVFMFLVSWGMVDVGLPTKVNVARIDLLLF